MRIHGDKKLARRPSVERRSPYGAYVDILREDFSGICGYCGKSELVTENTFEIDHFVPQKYAPERKEDYLNLVYSCYVCNRKKFSKWISENKDVQFVDGAGFVDPASEEFDNHLERDEQGNIIGKTVAGRYMVTEGVEFDKRPIKEIFKAMLLLEKKRQLREKMSTVAPEILKEYIEMDELLEQMQSMLFEKKE